MSTLGPAVTPQVVNAPVAGNVMDRISEISDVEGEATPAEGSSGSELVDKIEAADPSDESTPVEAQPTGEEPAPEAEAKTSEEETAEEGQEVANILSDDGLEIPENTVFTKKVDGKDVKISIKDLLDDFSGKTAVKSRFSEANQIKQRAEAKERKITEKEQKIAQDLSKTNSVITRFLEASKEGRQRDAMDALCELTGADSEKTWTEHQNAQKQYIEKYFSMSPEERFLYEKEQDAEYWKRRATDKNSNEINKIKTIDDTQAKLDKVAKEHGLSRQELTLAHNMLLDLADKGVYSKNDITVDSVANEALNIKIWGQIDEFTRENLPTKHGDAAFYREVLSDTRKHGITEAQWRDLAKDLKSGKPPTKVVTSKLAEKVEKSKPFSRKPQVTKSKQTDDSDDIWSFDDL